MLIYFSFLLQQASLEFSVQPKSPGIQGMLHWMCIWDQPQGVTNAQQALQQQLHFQPHLKSLLNVSLPQWYSAALPILVYVTLFPPLGICLSLLLAMVNQQVSRFLILQLTLIFLYPWWNPGPHTWGSHSRTKYYQSLEIFEELSLGYIEYLS